MTFHAMSLAHLTYHNIYFNVNYVVYISICYKSLEKHVNVWRTTILMRKSFGFTQKHHSTVSFHTWATDLLEFSEIYQVVRVENALSNKLIFLFSGSGIRETG